MMIRKMLLSLLVCIAAISIASVAQARTQKPVLHGQHWVAITGKPLAASAGARIFYQGGNAVDAACAMLAATSTMWDTLSWGGETQALIYDPRTREVIGINALGVAPSGATAAFFRERGLRYPPAFGPLAAVTPGTPGGLMVMLAEYGTLSLAEVLAPAIEMARGYPIEAGAVHSIEHWRDRILEWPASRAVFFPDGDDELRAPRVGEIFRQPDLEATLEKLTEAERNALAAGLDRKAAIYAAYDRFYRGDIAAELVRATQAAGGLITMADLDAWEVKIEQPVSTNYRGIEVYKLTTWVQGPVMLQTLNILENFDLAAMGYNSTRYIHTLYQAMNLAYADRDFYYGDPYFPPVEPIDGLLSKQYARQRAALIDPLRNDPDIGPGDPYRFQAGRNPFLKYLRAPQRGGDSESGPAPADDEFFRGTTSIQAADEQGWIVSVTPSGGWIPAFIAGRTGIGLSQRMQSFVLDPAENPYNVVEPGKRPRATLTPGMAFRDGQPFLSFAVQGGDAQDQYLLQFFLDVVEFGMNVQQAAEADNFLSFQMHDSFGDHRREPGRLVVNESLPEFTREQLRKMGYRVEIGLRGNRDRTSGPINAIYFDPDNGTFQGGSSNHGDDYGIAW
ncbi:MAG: gamma-glutamyltransferase family protein [Gammaproteobacteria bacterium]|nr:MAG: gamma-glutamyltransferase family protein [Gammaproteobacteria bacterium]